MNRHGLRDDQFARIEQLLPGRPGYVGRNSDRGNRLFVEAVIWKFRTGVPWRDMPARFGPWKNIHTRFSRWATRAVWESLFKALADDPDNEYAMIDATIVRAHQHSAGARKKKGVNQAIGRSRGGLTTKIHMIVDALGNPLAFSLTGGQVHDITQAETLTAQVQPEAVLGDKGYDADSYIASLRARAIQPVIPPKANRKNKRAKTNAIAISRFTENAIWSNDSSNSSNNSVASPRATKRRSAIFSQDCNSFAPWLGSNEDTP
jgi:transposase